MKEGGGRKSENVEHVSRTALFLHLPSSFLLLFLKTPRFKKRNRLPNRLGVEKNECVGIAHQGEIGSVWKFRFLHADRTVIVTFEERIIPAFRSPPPGDDPEFAVRDGQVLKKRPVTRR